MLWNYRKEKKEGKNMQKDLQFHFNIKIYGLGFIPKRDSGYSVKIGNREVRSDNYKDLYYKILKHMEVN